MKQNIFIAALLAAMLAIAGCGGGSSSSSDEVTDEVTPPTTPTTPTTPTGGTTPAALTGTGLTRAGTINIPAGGKSETPNGGTISCTSSTACVVTVAANNFNADRTPVVTVTAGMASFAAKADPMARRTNQGGSDIDWLSRSSLLNAVKVQGSTVTGIVITTPNGVEHELLAGENRVGSGGTFDGDEVVHEANGGSAVGKVTIDAGGGDDLTIRLIHTRGRTVTNTGDNNTNDRDTTLSDYLVYGAWLQVTGADGGPQNDPQTEVLVAGSIPWDTDNLPSTGDARYEGKALGYYKLGKVGVSDPWLPWDGTVELKANFSRNTSAISGSIRTGIMEGPDASRTELIATLGRHAIGQNGKVSGIGSGTWEASFYGTEINGTPNGIAGSFKTQRAAVPGGTKVTPQSDGSTLETVQQPVQGAVVEGAFGAHWVGQILDDEQQGTTR